MQNVLDIKLHFIDELHGHESTKILKKMRSLDYKKLEKWRKR